ncbi:MAG: hypothetical protein IJZ42_13585 [Lachnospiraceae bacterium]|nr:hypothetical protein [Lachnospiraceae bacterium]
MRFDFNEINILKQNLYNINQKKHGFIEMLQNIYENTEDPLLKDSVQSLIKKVSLLSQEELSSICASILQKKVAATMNDPFSISSMRNENK